MPTLTPTGHLAGKPVIPLKRTVYVIGSRHNAHLHLLSRQVSKAHALLVNADDGIYIRDLASRTKTFVNGKAVREAELKDGDKLQIGTFTLTFHVGRGHRTHHAVPAKARLEVQGADAPLPVDQRVMLIGRRATCDIPLVEVSVSTAHAIIFWANGKHWLRDLGSRTGSFLNGRKIHQQELKHGDQIRVGETDMRFLPWTEEAADLLAEHAAAQADELEDLLGTARLMAEDGGNQQDQDAPEDQAQALKELARAAERAPQDEPDSEAPIPIAADEPIPLDIEAEIEQELGLKPAEAAQTAARPQKPLPAPQSQPQPQAEIPIQIDLDEEEGVGADDTGLIPLAGDEPPRHRPVPAISDQIVDTPPEPEAPATPADEVRLEPEPQDQLVGPDLHDERLSSSHTHVDLQSAADEALGRSPDVDVPQEISESPEPAADEAPLPLAGEPAESGEPAGSAAIESFETPALAEESSPAAAELPARDFTQPHPASQAIAEPDWRNQPEPQPAAEAESNPAMSEPSDDLIFDPVAEPTQAAPQPALHAEATEPPPEPEHLIASPSPEAELAAPPQGDEVVLGWGERIPLAHEAEFSEPLDEAPDSAEPAEPQRPLVSSDAPVFGEADWDQSRLNAEARRAEDRAANLASAEPLRPLFESEAVPEQQPEQQADLEPAAPAEFPAAEAPRPAPEDPAEPDSPSNFEPPLIASDDTFAAGVAAEEARAHEARRAREEAFIPTITDEPTSLAPAAESTEPPPPSKKKRARRPANTPTSQPPADEAPADEADAELPAAELPPPQTVSAEQVSAEQIPQESPFLAEASTSDAIEVIEDTQPTPESALDLDAQEPSLPADAQPADAPDESPDALSDTGFAAMVESFDGDAAGPIVEEPQAAEHAPLDETHIDRDPDQSTDQPAARTESAYTDLELEPLTPTENTAAAEAERDPAPADDLIFEDVELAAPAAHLAPAPPVDSPAEPPPAPLALEPQEPTELPAESVQEQYAEADVVPEAPPPQAAAEPEPDYSTPEPVAEPVAEPTGISEEDLLAELGLSDLPARPAAETTEPAPAEIPAQSLAPAEATDETTPESPAAPESMEAVEDAVADPIREPIPAPASAEAQPESPAAPAPAPQSIFGLGANQEGFFGGMPLSLDELPPPPSGFGKVNVSFNRPTAPAAAQPEPQPAELKTPAPADESPPAQDGDENRGEETPDETAGETPAETRPAAERPPLIRRRSGIPPPPSMVQRSPRTRQRDAGPQQPAPAPSAAEQTIPPFAPDAPSAAAGGFDGLALPPVREVDVFSQLSPTIGDAFFRGRPIDPVDLSIPAFGTPAIGQPAQPQPDRPQRPRQPGHAAQSAAADEAPPEEEWHDEGEGLLDADEQPTESAEDQPPPRRGSAQAGPGAPRRPPSIPPQPPQKKRRWFGIPMLLLAMLAAMAAAATSIYLLVPTQVLVRGVLRFDRLDKLNPAERRAFEDTQRKLLATVETYHSAQGIFKGLHSDAPDGFLRPPGTEFFRIAERPQWDASGLSLAYLSSDETGDSARMHAVIKALYNVNAARRDVRDNAAQAVKDAEAKVAFAQRALSDLQDKIEKETRAAEDRPSEAQLAELDADVSRLNDAWKSAYSAALTAAADLERARRQAQSDESLADAPAQSTDRATDHADSDEQLAQLQQRLDKTRDRLAAARATRSEQADRARRAMDAALEQFQQQVQAVQKLNNPELAAYVSAATRFQEVTKRLMSGLAQRQQKLNARVTELRASLAKMIQDKRDQIWASDPQLQDLQTQREFTTRLYNQATADGDASEIEKVKQDQARLDQRIEDRKKVLGDDRVYSTMIAQLQQIMDDDKKDFEQSRADSEQQIETLDKSIAAAAPSVEKLPAEQKAVADDLQKRLAEINDARRRYAEAAAAQSADANPDLKDLESQQAEITAAVESRKKELAGGDPKTPQQQARLAAARSKAVEDSVAALTSAQKLETDARQAYLAKYEQLLGQRALVNAAAQAAQRRQQLESTLASARSDLDAATRERDDKAQRLATIVTPVEPTAADVQLNPLRDTRAMYMGISTGAIAVVFAMLILLASRSDPAPEYAEDEPESRPEHPPLAARAPARPTQPAITGA